MNTLSKQLFQALQQGTQAPRPGCEMLADRIAQEATRLATIAVPEAPTPEQQQRAIAQGLAMVKQCVHYYHLGSYQGRIALHSELQATLYQAWLQAGAVHPEQTDWEWVDDFLQGFYGEALTALRQEHHLDPSFCPRILLELAEYMAFVHRYGHRLQRCPSGRSYPLVVIRAWQFLKSHDAHSGSALENSLAVDLAGTDAPDWEPTLIGNSPEELLPEALLRSRVVEAFLSYLQERNQEDCADYFTLRLMDLSLDDIEAILHLTPRQRGHLQQRLQYHLGRFALTHHWELVHDWLSANLHQNLGLTPQQWALFQERLSDRQRQLLAYYQGGLSEAAIAAKMGLTLVQCQKQWSTLLGQAWELRNADF